MGKYGKSLNYSCHSSIYVGICGNNTAYSTYSSILDYFIEQYGIFQHIPAMFDETGDFVISAQICVSFEKICRESNHLPPSPRLRLKAKDVISYNSVLAACAKASAWPQALATLGVVALFVWRCGTIGR